MPNLQSYGKCSSLIDGELTQGGSIDTPTSIVVNGQKHEVVYSVANGANAVVYNDQLSTFEFLFLQSDYNTRALITDSGSNQFSLGLRGTAKVGEYGIALQLGLDETVNASNTINTIQVFNTSGSTAKVKIIVIK